MTIGEEFIVVGAWLEDGGDGDPCDACGAIYLYRRNNPFVDDWAFFKKLVGSNPRVLDKFGSSVAINGGIIAVGAPDVVSNAGFAEIFARNQGGLDHWGQVKKLISSDIALEDNFGTSVAISDSHALVGAYLEDGGSGNPYSNAGAAYVFHRNVGGADNWGEVRKLMASEIRAGDQFGASAAIDDELLAVGANYAGVGGIAYLFQLQPIDLYLYLPVVKK